MKITNNFKSEEFEASTTASANGWDNTLPVSALANVIQLCEALLQPLRDRWKQPIVISSGYRSEKLNTAVGGVATSQHRLGEAADCVVNDPLKFYNLVLDSGLDFDEMGIYNTFVHLSYRKNKNRKKTFDKRR